MHAKILKRVGNVLVVIGIIDIAFMIYCITNKISYSSSFNIFSIVAGMFLIKGSLGAALLVRWLAAFMLGALLTILFTFSFVEPIDLIFAQIKLNFMEFLGLVLFTMLVSILLFWLVRELSKKPILDARKAEGRKIRSIKTAYGAGVLIVIFMTAFLNVLLNGESAHKAMAIALKDVSSDYKAHVTSLNISTGSNGKSVNGVVTIWNKKEVRNVPVSWRE